MAKIHRFIGDFDLNKKEFEIEDGIAHQIITVLKLKVGEKIELSDGKHTSAMAEISEIKKNKVLVKIEKISESKKDVKQVNLFCAILKKENFEMVVQKTTECGISKIVPIISARTVKTGLNKERLRKIAKEASEQSGRINVPEISEPITFIKSLELINKKDSNILFDITGEKILNSEFAKNYQLKTINLFVGPEGGWAPEEIAKTCPSSGGAKNLNFNIVSLGPLTLRGETAAIVATYLLAN